MKMTFLVLAASAALVAGCGSDKKTSDNSPEGQVKTTILDWTFKQDKCPYMTDKFIGAQAFIGNSRQDRCEFIKKTYIKPRYSKSDVKFRKVQVGPTTATATIGSDFANVTATYKLVKTGDRWLIDEAD